jgi:hypothetical protein
MMFRRLQKQLHDTELGTGSGTTGTRTCTYVQVQWGYKGSDSCDLGSNPGGTYLFSLDGMQQFRCSGTFPIAQSKDEYRFKQATLAPHGIPANRLVVSPNSKFHQDDQI